jgi:peptide/nickel transport system permease protein
MSGLEIIAKELMPNLIPFLVASLVNATASAILVTIGLSALGLGPVDAPTLGMTIYWTIVFSAVLQGFWWWLSPIVIVVLIFVGLFLTSLGMDEFANPRLRRAV